MRACLERGPTGCVKSSTLQLPSIAQAALTPDQRTMVTLLRLNTPEGQDTSETYVRKLFAMPAGILPGVATPPQHAP